MAEGPFLQSVGRALAVLELAAARGSVGVQAVADALGLTRSTAHRLVADLRDLGYLEPTDRRGAYRLTLKLFSLGSQVRPAASLRTAGQGVLRGLVAATGETANLALWHGGTLTYVDRAEPSHSLRTVIRVGDEAPLHCTAVGKAVLARLAAPERRELLPRSSLQGFTQRTIVSAEGLGREIERTARRGYAINDQEHDDAVRAIGAPVADDRGLPVGAVSVAGPVGRMPARRLAALGRLVVEAAEEIACRLGFRRFGPFESAGGGAGRPPGGLVPGAAPGATRQSDITGGGS